MISRKNIDKVLEGAIAAMPAIPYIKPRRRRTVLPYVLGGIGLALIGGMAAVMLLSPRTRSRAMDMAKNTYGKINEQIGQLSHLKTTADEHASNGIAKGYSATGL